MFRLMLKDKGQSPFSINEPESFLSEKSIQRRINQGIDIDETDLPIDSSYFSLVNNTGTKVVAQSKWLKTITVETKDSLDVNKLLSLPFVDTLFLVWRDIIVPMPEDTLPTNKFIVPSGSGTGYYGSAFDQIAMHNGNLLHEKGYKGEGITIAVFDGGFHNVDFIDAFDTNKILGTQTFSHVTANPFRIKADHGTEVLSCMFSNKPNVMVGTAPGAFYYLFCSEVDGPEFPVEEDYWISAIEYADSIGIDIASTSLGYTVFPKLSEMNHHQDQLDGQTVLISKASEIAAKKGILLLTAAGNEGSKSWRSISFPSDAAGILTLGAVYANSNPANFTPYGPTVDGRTKPDLMATGVSTSLIASNGTHKRANGTSYATPIMAGLAACLWQAFPTLTNMELIEIMQKSGDKYNTPDERLGYGIPDVFNAYESQQSSLPEFDSKQNFIRHIGPYLLINVEKHLLSSCKLTIYSVLGGRMEVKDTLTHASVDVSNLPRGLYIALLEGPTIRQTCKFINR